MNTEFLIIGGGVIGLSIARAMLKHGARSITIVDRGRIGGEASWAAAGMLAPNAETRNADDFFIFCTESNALYPEFATGLLDETGIDIELDRCGTLYLGFTEADSNEINEKFTSQKNLGIEVEFLSKEGVLELEPQVSPLVHSGLFYPNDWQVENRKMIAALRRFAELNDIKMIENSAVTELMIKNGRLLGVKTVDDEFTSATTILTAGAWTTQLLGDKLRHAGQVKAIRGQMIGFQAAQRPFGCVIYSPRGYVVPRADGRILAGATVEDVGFRKEVTGEAIESLRSAALEIAPVIANFNIKESWAGLRPFAADGLPVIGRLSGIVGLILATGHYRNGILLAPITGKILADELVSGVTSDHLRAFGPDRFEQTAWAAKP